MSAELSQVMDAHDPILFRQLRKLGVATLLLAVCFCWPLLGLLKFAWHSELFSYILLIPFISGYLIWTSRASLNLEVIRPCWLGAALAWGAAVATIVGYWLARNGGWEPEGQDYLTVMIFALLCCFWGAGLAIMGSKLLGQIFFPVAFLAFAVPIPAELLDSIDSFFQYTSAATAQGFFNLAHMPMVREGLNLHLSNLGHAPDGYFYLTQWRRGLDPGLAIYSLRVAPECSGIHSTMVLVMTSLLAGHLFLRRTWTKTVMVLAMIPLAILRNGFRVSVIGWLCVHISPKMIDSPIHRKGGPVFFALSLIPFFLLLVYLRRQDFPVGAAARTQPKS